MKSNSFKSESVSNRFIMQGDRDRDRASFRGRRQQENRSGNAFGVEKAKAKEKEKELELNIENFPSLSANVEPQTNEERKEGGYASALNKSQEVNENELTTEKVQPGWVRIKLDDSSRRFICEYGESSYNKEEPSLNDEMNYAIELMKERWRQHKENYIDLYGEDEYDRYYPQYISTNSGKELEDEDEDQDY